MSRLPEPGKDIGTWGIVLNDYLSQSHNADGSIKNSVITPAALAGNIPQSKIINLETDISSKANTSDLAGFQNNTYTKAESDQLVIRSPLSAPFFSKNVLTQSDLNTDVTGIGYVSSPNTLAVLQCGGVSGGGWFMPFASTIRGKGYIDGYAEPCPSQTAESMIGCDGTHYLNAMQSDSLFQIDAQSRWELTPNGLPMATVDYEYARPQWGISLSAKAFAKDQIIYIPCNGQGTPQLRYSIKYDLTATGTHYVTEDLAKGDAHAIVITHEGWPCKFVIGAYPASHWYVGAYRDVGAASWGTDADIESPYTANPVGAGFEWSSAGATNLKTCFAVALMPATMSDAEVKDAMITGLSDWEGKYTASLAEWEELWGDYTNQWDNIDPEIRSKGLIAAQQIMATSYNGAITAGTPTWIDPGVWIRDVGWSISNLAEIAPSFCKTVMQWFINAPSMTGHNSYTLDGVVKDLASVFSTDSSAVFLLAAAAVWEADEDLILFELLKDQINSALVYSEDNFVLADKHMTAKHPHDYWDDYPLYGGEMDTSLVKYESFIDVLWAVALRNIAPVYATLGETEKATYCVATSEALILGLEDYRDELLGGGFHYAIKTDNTLYDTVIASPANIYASKYLNDVGARKFLYDYRVVSMLGLRNFKENVVLSFSNYMPTDANSVLNKLTCWGPHVLLVAAELSKIKNMSLIDIIKNSCVFGSWGEGVCVTAPSEVRGLLKYHELSPQFTFSLGEMIGLCNALSADVIT